jgi:3-oxoacyl-[acyl-carrier-protein] synthase II
MVIVNKLINIQPIYIRSAASISPRQGEPGQGEPGQHQPGQGEPDYRTLLDPKLLRRMSRIIRMGAAAAVICLREAGIAMPDAIVTGTAYGCLEDTGLFLTSLIERNEETLQPATFIQSTHNTVGAQIALLLGCTGYNNTFVHRGFSFESALLDAALLLADGEAATVLLGGVDEITETSRALLARFGLYRRVVAGEGAAFFLLAGQPSGGDLVTGRPSGGDLARLDGFHRFYKPSTDEDVHPEVINFLHLRGLEPADIDQVITGDNGDGRGDLLYREIRVKLFPGKPNQAYKDLSGEYPTSTSFALGLAAQQVKSGAGRVLLYNHYLGIYHSLYLLSGVDQ